jgi:hypothetical protein
MRRFSRLIIFMASLGLFFSTTLVAQDSTKSSMQTLFGGKGAKYKINYLGLYFAPEFQYGQLDGSFTPMGGMSMMLQVNKKWGIGMTGFAGRGSSTDTTQNGGHFAGLKLEYTPKPNNRFHVSFPLMVGMGQTGGRGFGDNMGRRNGRNHGGFDGDDDRFDYNGIERSSYAVIQPGVSAEANLFRYAKVFAGANYRFAFNSSGYSTALQGFSTNVGVKIGVFDYALKDKKNAKKMRKQKHLQE